jgi:hypothetical protein
MAIIVGRRQIVGDVAGEIARLEVLRADLQRIAGGKLPTIEELASAPLLSPWRLGTSQQSPPAHRDAGGAAVLGPLVRSTDVCVFAPDLGWARTLSRFYRLGRMATGPRTSS